MLRSPRSGSKLRIRIKLVAFSLIPLLVLLITLESVQRVRYAYRYNDNAWLFYGLATQLNTAPPEIPLLGASRTYQQPEASSQPILYLGGSSTYGVYNDRQHTYPYILTSLINSDLSASQSSYHEDNLGIPGMSSNDYLTTLVQEFDRDNARTVIGRHYALTLEEFESRKPALVIIYAGYNDIFIQGVNREYEAVLARLGSILRTVNKFSLLTLTVTEKILIIRSNRRGERSPSLEKELRENMAGVLTFLAKQDVPALVVPEVVMAQEFGGPTRNYTSYASRYSQIPELLADVARVHGAEYVRLDDAFSAADYQQFFLDPVHLTDQGNEKLSRLLLERSELIQGLLGSQAERNGSPKPPR